jgi:hypothetical protein
MTPLAKSLLLLTASALRVQATPNTGSTTAGTNWLDPAILAALIAGLSAFILYIVRKVSEKRAINRAVLAEIKRLVSLLENHKTWWLRLIADKDTNYPLIPFSYVVYKKQIKNIGELSPSLVAKTVQFYGYVDFLNALQASRDRYGPAKSAEFDQVYLKALLHCTGAFGKAFDDDFRKMQIP